MVSSSFILQRLALTAVLSSRKAGLDAEVCALSTGVISDLGHRSSIAQNPEKTSRFRKIRRIFSTAIRYLDCAGLEKNRLSSKLDSASIDVKIIGSHRTKVFSHPPLTSFQRSPHPHFSEIFLPDGLL